MPLQPPQCHCHGSTCHCHGSTFNYDRYNAIASRYIAIVSRYIAIVSRYIAIVRDRLRKKFALRLCYAQVSFGLSDTGFFLPGTPVYPGLRQDAD